LKWYHTKELYSVSFQTS